MYLSKTVVIMMITSMILAFCGLMFGAYTTSTIMANCY